ncbi:MAG: CBS domain-containing protein [Acidobacteria bacterium]|nr:CBS domain-containing protein [Acidobacteriota bacterium]
MKVKDVMAATARTCGPATSLAEAAALMLDEDCGFLPVVDRGHLVGVVTDRDLYIALATRNALASALTVGEVAQAPVWSVAPDDDVHEALAVMREHRVRRLPVTGFGETVLGVISMNDILLAAGPKRPVSSTEVLDALQEICGHHHPAPHVSVA